MAYAYLELADYLLIAEAVVGVPAETLAQSDRVVALADSALSAPAASFAGQDFYPELVEKAAVLCSHLVRNHPLPDGTSARPISAWSSSLNATAVSGANQPVRSKRTM